MSLASLKESWVLGWNLNDIGSQAHDSSNNNFIGTVNGATSITGKIGNGRYFDGTDDWIYRTEIATNTNNISQAIWFKLGSGTLGSIREMATTGGRFYMNMRNQVATDTLECAFFNSTWHVITSTRTLVEGVWYLAVHTKSDTGQKLYLGKEGDSDIYLEAEDSNGGDVDYATPTATWPTTIGAFYSPLRDYKGNLDSFNQWNRVLTDGNVSLGQAADGEVAELWNGGVGIELSLPLIDRTKLIVHVNNDWVDTSEDSATPTVVGAILNTTSKLGSHAGEFDGIDDNVHYGTPSKLAITDVVTVAAWVKRLDDLAQAVILHKVSGFGLAFGTIITGGTNQPAFHLFNNIQGWSTVLSPDTIDNVDYHLVVGTFDGTYQRLFVDNVLKGEVYWPYAIDAQVGMHTSLGSYSFDAGPDGWFSKALIDEGIVWNRAISYGGDSIGQQATGEMAELWNDGDGVEVEVELLLTDGLISLWQMNEVWTDSIGNNHGVADGALFNTIDPKLGSGCGSFDGIDDRILLDPIDFTGNNFTISAWVYQIGSGTIYDTIFSGHTSSFGGLVFYSQHTINSDKPRVAYYTGTWSELDGDTAIPLSEWTLLTFVRNGDSLFLYMNDTKIGSKTETSTFSSSDGASIGSQGTSNYFPGRLDEVAIWDRSLTFSEIEELYNDGEGLDLVAVTGGVPLFSRARMVNL